jgi:hypothetical protein
VLRPREVEDDSSNSREINRRTGVSLLVVCRRFMVRVGLPICSTFSYNINDSDALVHVY